jgi:hypothetical protein
MCEQIANDGKIVLVAALDADFKRKVKNYSNFFKKKQFFIFFMC